MQHFFLLGCLLLFGVASAQHTVSGTLTDTSGHSVSGAHIHAGSVNLISGQDGQFEFKAGSGNLRLFVTQEAHEPLDTLISVSGNMTLMLRLREIPQKIKEVTVLANRDQFNKSVREDRLKGDVLEQYSSASLGDALKEIPGVTTLKTGSTVVKPVINGLYGSRVPVIAGGVRLEDQQWGTEHAPNADLNSAGSVTVVKGASALQYGGDAIGGLVIIEPVISTRDTIFGKSLLTLNSNGRGGSFSTSVHRGNFCDWAWNVSATGKYMGDREAPDYVLSNTGNREANLAGDLKYIGRTFNIKFGYSLYNATIGILKASHTGNANDLYNSINNQLPSVIEDFTHDIGNPKQKVMHHLAYVDFRKELSDRASLNLHYAFQLNQREEYDMRRGDYADIPALDLRLITHTLMADYKKLFEGYTLKAGGNFSFQNNFASPETGVMPLIPSYDKFDGGLYGVLSVQLDNRVTLEGGLRYDFSRMDATKYYRKSRWTERGYDERFSHFIIGESGNQWLTNPVFNFHNVSASAGIHKRFENQVDLHSNASLAMRNPGPGEFFSDGLHHSTGIIELGDLALQREVAYKFSATLEKKWNRISIGLNPYLNVVSDFMYLQPIGFETTTRGAFPVWEYRQTDARLFGIDVKSTWNWSESWHYQLQAAYVNGQDLGADRPLIDMPPFNLSQKISFKKSEWHQFQAEVKSELTAQQSRFPNNNFETNIIVNDEFAPVLVDISTPPPAYHLLHFASEMTFKTFKMSSLTVRLSVQNIFDTTYRDYLNRQRFFADETGRNVQLQLKFNY